MATSNFRTIQTNFTEGVQFTKNYIPNATFQNGSTSNWGLFTTTLSNGLPQSFYTIGAPSITTFSTTTTTPISGSHSMQIASSGVWSAGQGVMTDAFTIEKEDLGKPVTFSLSFEAVANATNANWSGILGSQTFAVYVYDELTYNWLQPSGFLGMNQSTGVGQVMGSFQTSVTSGQQYRLAIIALQASSGPITLNIDNVFLGKEISTVGTPVTDWQQYTPTFVGITTTTSSAFFWRRVGDSIEIFGSCNTTGVSTSATFSISIPPGYTIDTLKGNSLKQIYGDMVVLQSSNTNNLTSRLFGDGVNNNLLYATNSPTASTLSKATIATLTIGSSGAISVVAKIPITGLSSSVQMSNATDTRVLSASVTGIPPSTISGSIFIFPTVTYDTHGAYSTSTGRYTVPVSGFVQISGIIQTTNNNVTFKVYKNGVAGSTFCYTTNNTGSGSVTVQCNAGDLLDLRPDATTGTVLYTGIQFNRLSGPSVIASTETVAASYSITAAASTAINVQFNFNNKIFDSHNAVTTGAGVWKFTAPISGKYQVSSSIINATSNNTMSIFKNGSVYRNMGYNIQSVATGASIPGVTIVHLNAGEYIDVRSGSNTVTPTAGAFSGATLSNSNFIDIIRIGN